MKLLLERLLTNNHYRLNQHDVSLQLLSHPDYPSLKSITDTLDYFKVENAALIVERDLIDQLPGTFIAQLNRNDYQETVLVVKNTGSVKITDDQGASTKATIDQFKETWNGNALLIEPLPTKPFTHGKTLLPILLFFGLLIISLQWIDYQLGAFASLITLLFGFAVSLFIVLEEYGNTAPIIKKVCKAFSESSSCTEVSKSEHGKIFKTAGLSDLSAIFFSSLLLTQILVGWHPMLGVGLSIVILPVILYSLYLQAFVLKNWCLLCFGIIASLLIYVGVNLLSLFNHPESFELSYFLKFIFILSSVLVIWTTLLPYYKKYTSLTKSERDYLLFKRNIDTFSSLLAHEDQVAPIGKAITPLTFGDPVAPIELVAITNPLCGFCQEAFSEYKKLLDQAGTLIKLNIVFNVAHREGSDAVYIAERLVSIYHDEGKDKAWDALDYWFTSRNLEAWKKKYKTEKSKYLHVVNSHYAWCKENKIYYTPATIVDGQLYPKAYQVSEFALVAQDYLDRKISSHAVHDILKD